MVLAQGQGVAYVETISVAPCCPHTLITEERSLSAIEFSSDEKEILAKKIQLYFHEELDSEIGQFDALFLLDFFSEEVGAYFYNRGLYDAQALIEKRVEDIAESVYELEKPTEFRR